MTDLFHNTPGEKGDKLKASKAKVLSQEEAVLVIFQWASGYKVKLWPSKVKTLIPSSVGGHNWPITSIRRAITNLTKAEKLVKTDRQVQGPYNHKEYLWRLP